MTKRNGAVRIARLGVFVALAMIFSYVEALFPISIGVPGVKLGLANLVVVVGLYLFSTGEAFLISLVRILLMGILFGNGLSLWYSLAGGLLSFLIMVPAKKWCKLSVVGVSMAGAVFHNVGQIGAAAFALQNRSIMAYLPVLLVSGVITGILIGILARVVIRIFRNTSTK